MKSENAMAIIGLGYVGLPLCICFAEAGLRVIGLDIDQTKVEALQARHSCIKHISSDALNAIRKAGSFSASIDFSLVAEVEAILICVPTPLNKYREPDISYVLESGKVIAPYLGQHSREMGLRPKLVVLESTTYPGTTDTELRHVLESVLGLKAGRDFHLAYSPEREDSGRADYSVRTIPKVIGGFTPACRKRCMELYEKAIDRVHPVSSCRVAEAAKLTENIYRSVNIAVVNELKVVFHKRDIDVNVMIATAATKPFGFMPFYPGPGLGGHCIPIDPFYLTWKAREVNQHTRFIELAGEINTAMPDYVVARVIEALNTESKSVNGARILLLGIADKPNVDDARESPSYVLMEKLHNMGAEVSYHAPHIPVIPPSCEHPRLAGIRGVDISPDYDLILLATHHDEYRTYDFGTYPCPVVDTRNCVQKRPAKYIRA